MLVPQAEMCWKVSATKIQLFPRKMVGGKLVFHSWKKENKLSHFHWKACLLSCTDLKLVGSNPFVREFAVSLSPWKSTYIYILRATYQPLKSCGPYALLRHEIGRNSPMVWMESHAIVTNVQMHSSESSTESWQELL